MKSKFEKWFTRVKPVKDFFILVISISTIHGFNHIIKKGYHPIERFIWFVLIICAVYEIASVSKLFLDRFQENPTVISMERDRYSWNTSFPGATICPLKKVDEKFLNDFLENSTDIKDKGKYRRFVTTLLNASYENLDHLVEYEGVSEADFLDIIKKFKFKFNPVLGSTVFTADYGLQMSFTELGFCYSFNTHLAVYNSPEYWKNGTWKLISQKDLIYVNPMDGEVFAALTKTFSDYKIYFHGPYEVADIASKSIHGIEGYYEQIFLAGLTIFTTDRARHLTIRQRKCRMYYESNLRHFPVYSYTLCRMECRANLALKLCGCLPHFYRKIGDEKICNIRGLKCLHQFKDRLIQIKEACCSCLPNCEETIFFVDDWYTSEFHVGTLLQWGIREYPKMRLKRDVIFGFADLLVYTGGVAGLFLGCSVLSFIEIIYFLTLRLYWFVDGYKKRTLILVKQKE